MQLERLHRRGSGERERERHASVEPGAPGRLKRVGLLNGKRFRLCLKSSGTHTGSSRGSDMITDL